MSEGFRRDVRCVLTELPDGSGVVLHLRTKHCYTLNATAVAVWHALDPEELRPVERIAASLTRQFAVDDDVAKAGALELLDDLVREGVIARGAPSVSP
jgi:hypothetical protein